MVKNPLSLSLEDLKSKFEVVTLPVTLVCAGSEQTRPPALTLPPRLTSPFSIYDALTPGPLPLSLIRSKKRSLSPL